MIHQPAVLLPPAPAGHALTIRLQSPAQAKALLRALAALEVGEDLAVGIGAPLAGALGAPVPGLRAFPVFATPEGPLPVTQGDVWFYARGPNPGAVLRRVLELTRGFPGGLVYIEDQPVFTYEGGRDLTGYEDGTENPKGDAANAAALVAEGPLAGSSFVAAQRWIHDLGAFTRQAPAEQDATIGRARADNAELPDAPPAAHVKRTAQESFEPAAFMLRRSMPFGTAQEHGLYFVAYGADLDRFDRVMRRMCGAEDGVVDALFRFSRPVSGGYYWCPAVIDGKLDLRPILPGGVEALPDVAVETA
jgi:putative iron-dependent peroxidase